ncbi:hypothetical protein [Arthrobacter sp. 18067]|uniref:hypothetical protein n=1 Tax=Arthrobacter sp. 18067 TaxID=2681413 RepID=UPI001357D150|nr:hypothetical protein [Arthrobacter sp. 18067]
MTETIPVRRPSAARAAWILANERRYDIEGPNAAWGPLPYSQVKKWIAYSPQCIGNHSDRARPPADRHAWLCGDCTDGIRRDLFTLAGCWDFLGEMLQRGPGKQGERSGSNENAAAPLDLNVADVRRQIQSWACSMLEHVAHDLPAMSMPDELSAPKMLAWLGRWHTFYIATHPQDSFPAAVLVELSDMVGKVRAMSFPDGARRRPISTRCLRYVPAVEDQDPVICGGRLSALIRERTDPRGSEIVCETNPSHVIPEYEWLALLKAKQRRQA